MVGGYVAAAWEVANIHWVEELLHWQRGSDGEFDGFLRVIFHQSSIYPQLTEKIGPPPIILVSDFQSLLGEHPQSIPVVYCFSSYTEKAKKKLGLDFALALDYFGLQVLVLVVFLFA